MANMNKVFLDFDDEIKLTKAQKDKILVSREAVRNKIRNYFSEQLDLNQPKFRIQGSFVINTALNPIGDNEVDTDDGIYLQHITDNDTWPTPKRHINLFLMLLVGIPMMDVNQSHRVFVCCIEIFIILIYLCILCKMIVHI